MDNWNLDALEVMHQPEQSRFAASHDGETAVVQYNERPNTLVFTHTEVPVAWEGKGVGSKMARTALKWAEELGKPVVPICPYMNAFIQRHPEIKVNLAPGFRR